MFLVYSRVILGYVISMVGKIPNPKKSRQSQICPHRKCLKTYRLSMGWPSSIGVSSRILPSLWPPSRNSYTKQRLFAWIAKCLKMWEAIK
jgi:hypothetical protein